MGRLLFNCSMQILCPLCSKEQPVSISCQPEDSFALCEKCSKRFRIRTFEAQRIEAEKQEKYYRYTCTWGDGAERFYSQEALALREGDILTTVRRGRHVLGVADQERDRWYPVQPPQNSHPLLRALALSLAWPVSLLVLLQITQLAEKLWSNLLQNPAGTTVAVIFFTLFLLAPLLLWFIRTLFPYGPGRERIRGYDPRL